MFCSECGANINDDVKFCDKCGTAQLNSEQPVKLPTASNNNNKLFIGLAGIVVVLILLSNKQDESAVPLAYVPEDAVVEETAQSNQEGQYGSPGYFLIKNNRYTFDDAKVEGNSMLDKQGENGADLIDVYGYITFYATLPNDPMEPLRLRIHPGKVGEYKSLGNVVTTNTDLAFDLVYRPQFISEEEFKNIKRTVLKVAGNKALIKIKGRMGLYTDSYQLFIAGTTLDIVAMENN
jgi:hypothetical protein